MSIPILAGTVSTVIFAGSVLPMLVKAARTKDLGSYSLGHILLANLGNAIHTVYVLNLPMGPIWALHGFYVASTGFMLVCYLRYAPRRAQRAALSRVQQSAPANRLPVPSEPVLRAATD
ncbi:MAG TPA: hypothetical protein VK028_00690 [Micromonosporaceae bacterium]|nr:hypothetical protein [Micromonosporaceae bacterium]